MLVLVAGGALTAGAQTLRPDDIVLWPSAATEADIHGDWYRIPETSAAGGALLYNPDRARARISPAQSSPANYFEMTFTAKRGTAYHLWVRMAAQGNSLSNDSVHVQFSDSMDSNGQAVMRIGTTGSAEPVLQAGPSGLAPWGWGWTDNGWGSPGTPIFFAADGTHVVRIQQREDGAIVDQIVLSPVTFATTPPGVRRADGTILPATSGTITPPPSDTSIVIRPGTAAAGRLFGNWHVVSDASAAGGKAVRNPNQGIKKIAPALANPASYFEASFTAPAGGPYHLWLRMKADSNSTANDSVHVQFSDSVTSGGTATARIGTTSSLEPVLQAGSGGLAPRGWGWADNGWGALGAHVYFATSGTHTIRVQQREDGPTIDQIVVSPDKYLTTAPGGRRDDQTIVPIGTTEPPPNQPPAVTLTAPAGGAAFRAPATISLAASASDPESRLARVEFYSGTTLLGTDSSAPYTFTWTGVAQGSYALKAVAVDADGASAVSSTVGVTVTGASTTWRIAFQASADHAVVTKYVLRVFAATADPDTATAVATSDLGKPTPSTTGEIVVDRSSFFNGLAAGNYQLTIDAVALAGTSRSAPITFTR